MTLKPGFGKLATVSEAFEILFADIPQIGSEDQTLAECSGRTLAEAVISQIDVPHFAKAAMDGYAVIAQDTFGASDAAPKQLRLIGSITPGDQPGLTVEARLCAEISTGSALPGGADAVVMVENTEPSSDQIHVRKAVAPYENVIAIGSDVKEGATVLEAGEVLEPRHLGVLAAVGVEKVSVRRRPQVALFSTGAEIVPAGSQLEAGRIYDINTHTLKAALIADGCDVIDLGIVIDKPDELDEAVRKGLESADFIVLSGGSSLGQGDLVTETFARAGEMLLHGVAVKPGKPLVVGRARARSVESGTEVSKLMIGLPGYPMSALSDYYIFVRPFIQKALNRSGETLRYTHATLGRKHPSTVGRYEFLPVKLDENVAIPLTKGSSAISALASADGFVEIDENTEVVDKGAEVLVRLF